MALIELTSTYTGRPVAIDPELIGEVKDLVYKPGHTYGQTLIIHRANRRVKWVVNESFEEVMGRIRGAQMPQDDFPPPETASGLKESPGEPLVSSDVGG